MITKIIEVTNNNQNWGKFLLGRPNEEWHRRPEMDPESRMPLLRQLGWTNEHIWVLDLQTGEGAYFRPGGLAGADLRKHSIWVCPMYEPFLAWLYQQDLGDITKLPDLVNLPDAPFEWRGYRRGMSAEVEQAMREAMHENVEYRRAILAELSPEGRELIERAFASLGLHQ